MIHVHNTQCYMYHQSCYYRYLTIIWQPIFQGTAIYISCGLFCWILVIVAFSDKQWLSMFFTIVNLVNSTLYVFFQPKEVNGIGAPFRPRSGKLANQPLMPEIDAYIHLLVVIHLIDTKKYTEVSWLYSFNASSILHGFVYPTLLHNIHPLCVVISIYSGNQQIKQRSALCTAMVGCT